LSRNEKWCEVTTKPSLSFKIGTLIKAGGLFHKRPGSRMRVIDSIPGLNVDVQITDLLRIFKLML